MTASPSTDAPTLTAAEAEAIATSIALHHYRAAQAAANSGPAPDRWTNWAREAVLQSVTSYAPQATAWGLPNWR